jgi:hypothetical protein
MIKGALKGALTSHVALARKSEFYYQKKAGYLRIGYLRIYTSWLESARPVGVKTRTYRFCSDQVCFLQMGC